MEWLNRARNQTKRGAMPPPSDLALYAVAALLGMVVGGVLSVVIFG